MAFFLYSRVYKDKIQYSAVQPSTTRFGKIQVILVQFLFEPHFLFKTSVLFLSSSICYLYIDTQSRIDSSAAGGMLPRTPSLLYRKKAVNSRNLGAVLEVNFIEAFPVTNPLRQPYVTGSLRRLESSKDRWPYYITKSLTVKAFSALQLQFSPSCCSFPTPFWRFLSERFWSIF